jgi:hypothetical protein
MTPIHGNFGYSVVGIFGRQSAVEARRGGYGPRIAAAGYVL